MARRASGTSLGEFFADAIANPLGIDIWIGAPPEVESRINPLIFPDMSPGAAPSTALADPESVLAIGFGNSGGHMAPGPDGFDSSPLRPAGVEPRLIRVAIRRDRGQLNVSRVPYHDQHDCR